MATSFSADSTFRPSGSGPSSISPRRRSGVGFVAAIRWPAHCAEDLDFAQLRVVWEILVRRTGNQQAEVVGDHGGKLDGDEGCAASSWAFSRRNSVCSERPPVNSALAGKVDRRADVGIPEHNLGNFCGPSKSDPYPVRMRQRKSRVPAIRFGRAARPANHAVDQAGGHGWTARIFGKLRIRPNGRAIAGQGNVDLLPASGLCCRQNQGCRYDPDRIRLHGMILQRVPHSAAHFHSTNRTPRRREQKGECQEPQAISYR